MCGRVYLPLKHQILLLIRSKTQRCIYFYSPIVAKKEDKWKPLGIREAPLVKRDGFNTGSIHHQQQSTNRSTQEFGALVSGQKRDVMLRATINPVSAAQS